MSSPRSAWNLAESNNRRFIGNKRLCSSEHRSHNAVVSGIRHYRNGSCRGRRADSQELSTSPVIEASVVFTWPSIGNRFLQPLQYFEFPSAEIDRSDDRSSSIRRRLIEAPSRNFATLSANEIASETDPPSIRLLNRFSSFPSSFSILLIACANHCEQTVFRSRRKKRKRGERDERLWSRQLYRLP